MPSGDALLKKGEDAQPRSLLAVVEMNLEEYPAFRLGRRSKRPELRYTRVRSDAEGHTVEQVWIVRGAEGLGVPGPFEQDLYVALLVLFTEQGLPADGRIRFTRNRLAKLMGNSNSGRGYELIEQGLRRLAGATVHTEHSFYRPGVLPPAGAAGRTRGQPVQRGGPAERLSLDFHILDEVRVYERTTQLFFEDPIDPTESEDPARPRVDRAKPFELSVARLGQPLVQSYERRYTKPLDASFYFTLTRPLAKRLYRYVDKVRNGRGGFEIGLRALGDVLGLEYRYPSDIKDGLAEAHQELREHGYLTSADYAPLAGGPNAGEKVVYAFNPTFDQRGKRRLTPPPKPVPKQEQPETSPLQLELESFGITPKRAAALVESFSEDHIAKRIEHVRARTKDGKATPLRNPAGYLAKAIEDSFAVKEATPAPAARPAAPPAVSQIPTGSPVVQPPSVPDPDGVWGALARALRTRLSGATYAAFVAPSLVAAPVVADGRRDLTLALPSSFAFEKWHRPPIKGALAEALAELGIALDVQLVADTADAAETATGPTETRAESAPA